MTIKAETTCFVIAVALLTVVGLFFGWQIYSSSKQPVTCSYDLNFDGKTDLQDASIFMKRIDQ